MTKISLSTPALLLWLSLASSTQALVPNAQQTTKRSASPLAAYLDTTVDSAATRAVPSSRVLPTTAGRSTKIIDPSAVVGDTVQLGSLTIPRVGVGTIAWSADRAADRYELEQLMQEACQQPSGLLLDTAERYGSNLKAALGLGWGETEKLTRRLIDSSQSTTSSSTDSLQSSAQHDPVVATKFTPSPWRTTVQSVVDACEDSRQRIHGANSDTPIDLYQLHMPDIVQPMARIGQKVDNKDAIYWDGIAECYHRGLIKNVGVCNYGPTLLTQCQEHLAKQGVPLASNQIAYSILGRHNGAQATLEKGNELGIQTLAFFPFAMGLLTGKYNTNPSKAPSNKSPLTLDSLLNSKRSRMETKDLYKYALGDGDTIPEGGISSLLDVMQDCADSHDKTLAQVALNYIICQGAVPIPGARTKAQFVDNMGAMGWRLTPAELSSIEEESERLGFGFEGAGFKRTSEKFVGYGVEKWVLD